MKGRNRVLWLLAVILVLVVGTVIVAFPLKGCRAEAPVAEVGRRNQRLEFYLQRDPYQVLASQKVSSEVWVHPRTGTIYPWKRVTAARLAGSRQLEYQLVGSGSDEVRRLAIEPDVEVYLVYEVEEFHPFWLWPWDGWRSVRTARELLF